MKKILLVLILFIGAASFYPAPEAELLQAGAAEAQRCVDHCGNGVCEEIVCMGLNCPCSENRQNCPQDCSK